MCAAAKEGVFGKDVVMITCRDVMNLKLDGMELIAGGRSTMRPSDREKKDFLKKMLELFVILSKMFYDIGYEG